MSSTRTTEVHPITTPRLTLRRFKLEDATALHPIFANATAMAFWSTAPHRTAAETEDFVKRTILATQQGQGDDHVVIYNGEIVGKAGLWNNVEIGFIFAPSVWGMGIGNEAVQAIMSHETAKGTPEVLADVDPRNARCIRLLKNNGFVQTGRANHTARVGDARVDSLYFRAGLLGG